MPITYLTDFTNRRQIQPVTIPPKDLVYSQGYYAGIYFVSCNNKCLTIGGSTNVVTRAFAHCQENIFTSYSDHFKKPLLATIIRIDDLDIAKQLKEICVKQFNPLSSYPSENIPEQIELANNNYFDSGGILFNSFYPDKFSIQSLIYAVQYSENPTQDLKLLAHIPYWEDKRYKPPTFGGGDITGQRPMIDAELKQLYAIRRMSSDRLTQILTKNQQDRAEYIKQVAMCVPRQSAEFKSFSQQLNSCCGNNLGIVNFYKELSTPHKVELLFQIVGLSSHEAMVAAANKELRNYF